jgi:hypothetical protein
VSSITPEQAGEWVWCSGWGAALAANPSDDFDDGEGIRARANSGGQGTKGNLAFAKAGGAKRGWKGMARDFPHSSTNLSVNEKHSKSFAIVV